MEATPTQPLITQARAQNTKRPLDIVLEPQRLDQENALPQSVTKKQKASKPPLASKTTPRQRLEAHIMPCEREMDTIHSHAYDLALYSENMIGGSDQERAAVLRAYYLRFNIQANKGKSFVELQEQIEYKKNKPTKTLEDIVYRALQANSYEHVVMDDCECDSTDDCECKSTGDYYETVTIDQVKDLLQKKGTYKKSSVYKKPPILSTFHSSPY